MKRQVVFIHGGEAYSNYTAYLEHLRSVPIDPFAEKAKRWSHTLGEDLGEEFEVLMPSMPNKHNSKYEEWKIWFERHFEFLRNNVVLIGWSQGGAFLVKYLVENDMPVSVTSLVLIAAPIEAVSSESGEDGGDFFVEEEKVSVVATKVGKIILLHSKDDFVVPYAHAEKFKRLLPDAELVTFENKGHFLQEDFPELIERIKSVYNLGHPMS